MLVNWQDGATPSGSPKTARNSDCWHLQYVDTQLLQDHGPKATNYKAIVFAEYLSEAFTPQSTIQHNVHDLEMEQNFSISIRVHGSLKLFTAKEIINEINKLNQKIHHESILLL